MTEEKIAPVSGVVVSGIAPVFNVVLSENEPSLLTSFPVGNDCCWFCLFVILG